MTRINTGSLPIGRLLSSLTLAFAPAAAFADYTLGDTNNSLSISGYLSVQGEYISAKHPTVPNGAPGDVSRLNEDGSELRFSGVRTLANGWQGFFTIGSEIASYSGANGDNTNTFAFRNTGAGLRGPFGEFAAGRWDIHYQWSPLFVDSAYLTAGASWSATSVLGYVNTSELIGNRYGDTILYNTPNFGGFVLHAIASRNGGTATNVPAVGITNARERSVNLAATYKSESLSAFVDGYDRSNATNVPLPYSIPPVASLMSQRALRAGMAYTLPIGLTLGVVVDRSREGHKVPTGPAAFPGERTATRTAYAFPIRYQTGPHAFAATYGRANAVTGNLFALSPIGTNDGTAARFVMVGYKYWFDSNTNVHVGFAQMHNQNNAAYDLYVSGGLGTAVRGQLNARGTEVQTIQVGLFYRF